MMKKLKRLSLILILPLVTGYTTMAQCNFEVSIKKTNISCFGLANGTAEVEVTGSTGPYTFLWSNNAESTAKIENLDARTYFVKVTDKNGCELTEFVSIEEPPQLELSLEVDHVLCNGNNTGEIRLQSTGGTGSHDIRWSNGENTPVITSLSAGDYSVKVTDENYCESTSNVHVSEPSAISVEGEVENALGYGTSDGGIDVSVEGGVAPYQFEWSSGEGFSDDGEDIHNIPAGVYELKVTDFNGCEKFASFEVLQPEALEIGIDVTHVLCKNGNDGEIQATVSGGKAPYQYEWSNSSIILNQTGAQVSGLSADTYSLKITDDNGISVYKRGIVIEEPSSILANLTPKPTSCYDSSDGEIDLTVTGGTGEYSFLWDNEGETTPSVNGLSAGDYSVRIVDENGCSLTAEATVENPTPLSISHKITPITCEDQSDGEISVTVTGGTPDYQFSWDNGQNTSQIDGLADGLYVVTATDAAGCQISEEFVLEPGTGNCISIPNAFTPNGDNINDTWEILNSHLYPTMTVQVFSKEGKTVFNSKGYENPWKGQYNGRDLPSGTYYYVIDFRNGDSPYKGTITIVR